MNGERHPTVRFAEAVLLLLEQGGFVATYKYAVLLALIDLCLEGTNARGEPPETITTRQLAEAVVRLYWPQVRPYPDPSGGARELRQSSGRQAKIVSAVSQFRGPEGDATVSLPAARLRDPDGWQRLLDEVEWTLVSMPLPRLQVIGREHRPLLYRLAWGLEIEQQRGRVRAYQQGRPGADFDNRLHLLPGVGEDLVALNGLLRPIIHREWARLVASYNDPAESRLEEFLFGASRVQLARVREPLVELQERRCFYCDRRLERAIEVDHFIPWARHAEDAIENLVAAHAQCNRDKRDFLAAADHLARWVPRFEPDQSLALALGGAALAVGWETQPQRVIGAARGLYLRLGEDARLWRSANDFEPARPEQLVRLLASGRYETG